MRVYGIDFTSSPTRKKPITCAVCRYDETGLRCDTVQKWQRKDFSEFEALLASDGPWIAGIDAPFGQSRVFVENMGWPREWASYVALVGELTKSDFRQLLERYRTPRASGDKEHKRAVDKLTRSMSPQNLRVNGMFFEVAPRLLASQANIPPVCLQNDNRTVVEAYPGVLARQLIGKNGYKDGIGDAKLTEQSAFRFKIISALTSIVNVVELRPKITDDPSGDELDALLCAVQAAWAWSKREENFGIPESVDPLEGWIVDESLYEAAA